MVFLFPDVSEKWESHRQAVTRVNAVMSRDGKTLSLITLMSL